MGGSLHKELSAMRNINAGCAAALLISTFATPVLADRASGVITAIDAWNADLITADRQAKYCKMSASPFAFYRGTNHLFWQDFANDARLSQFGNSKTYTWLQGDLHASNYGAYDDDNGTIVYDVNDFDETVIADYQYDVWRMAVSLVLVARENGLSGSEQQTVVDAFTENYLDTIAAVHGNDDELNTSFTASNTYGLLDNFLDDVEQNDSRNKMLDKWAPVTGSTRLFDLTNEKLGAVDTTTRAGIINAMADYGATLDGGLNYDPDYFAVKDVAQRLQAGIGSLGTPRYYVLIEGATTGNNDDRILDVKRQSYPTPYYFLGATFQQDYDALFINDAQRHAIAEYAITRHTDDHLGWMLLTDGTYSVRELSPFKETFDTTTLDTETRFTKLAEQWGAILAMDHARADKDFDPNYVPYSLDKQVGEATNGHHAEFRALVRSIAFDYADQVQTDWNTFIAAYSDTCGP